MEMTSEGPSVPDAQKREAIKTIVCEVLRNRTKRPRRLRPIAVLVLLISGIYFALYVNFQMSRITAQQGIVLQAVVTYAAAANHLSPDAIWQKIGNRVGTSDPMTMRQWYYPAAIQVAAHQIELARLSPPLP